MKPYYGIFKQEKLMKSRSILPKDGLEIKVALLLSFLSIEIEIFGVLRTSFSTSWSSFSSSSTSKMSFSVSFIVDCEHPAPKDTDDVVADEYSTKKRVVTKTTNSLNALLFSILAISFIFKESKYRKLSLKTSLLNYVFLNSFHAQNSKPVANTNIQAVSSLNTTDLINVIALGYNR